MSDYADKTYTIGVLNVLLVLLAIIIVILSLKIFADKTEKHAPTPTEYTLHGMRYAEFPSGAVVNLTLDSMAKGSRVVLNYSQHIKPCP